MKAETAATGKGLPNPLLRLLNRMGIDAKDHAAVTGPLGVTAKETIYAQGTLKLHHYRPLAESVYRIPVLIVTSLVNQPYILDLIPGQSMVEFLLRQGYDVYLIEWGRPRQEHKDLTLEDHVQGRLPECVARVLAHSGEKQLTMIGYCVGGLLAALYASLYPKAPVKNLVLMAAPINSDGLVSLKAWMGEHFDEESLLAQFGNVPADWMQNALRALRPLGKVAGTMSLLNNVDKPGVVASNLRMTKWETDNIPFPGGVFRQVVRDFMRGNKFVSGTWEIGGKRADPRNIRMPVLHLLAQEDHITPYDAARSLLPIIASTDKQEIIVKGGHVGLVAGRGAETRMWPALDSWLAPRSV